MYEAAECQVCGHPLWCLASIATGICRACELVARTRPLSPRNMPATTIKGDTVTHCPGHAAMHRTTPCYPGCGEAR